jgi:hypothetical protein
MESLTPVKIPALAKKQIVRVLNLMSPYSIRRMLPEIEQGHIDGSSYGGLLSRSTWYERTSAACFLGWAGFLENKSVYELARQLHWSGRYLGHSPLEDFVGQIYPGDTPQTSPHSAALHQLVSTYLAERVQREDEVAAGPVSVA